MSSEDGGVHLQEVRGVLIPAADFFKRERIEAAMDYAPLDGDLIIASYPKTGTHWIEYTALQILSKAENFPSILDSMTICPYMEISDISVVENLKDPRMYFHHFPYDKAPKNPLSKVLYIYREPADVFVSYFHFMRGLDLCPLSFDQYFEDFLTGRIGYGRYFEHLLSYLAHEDDPNLLMVSYEKLHRNRREEILRIAKFLGDEHHRHLAEDEGVLQKVMLHTSFDYMKEHLAFDKAQLHEGGPARSFNFFRKGVVGDSKQALSPEQLRRVREMASEVLKGTRFLREWYGEEDTK